MEPGIGVFIGRYSQVQIDVSNFVAVFLPDKAAVLLGTHWTSNNAHAQINVVLTTNVTIIKIQIPLAIIC